LATPRPTRLSFELEEVDAVRPTRSPWRAFPAPLSPEGTTMSRYVGLDVHKQFIEVCILDAAGHVTWRGRTGCLRNELESFARTKLKKTDRVALEATTNTWAVVTI